MAVGDAGRFVDEADDNEGTGADEGNDEGVGIDCDTWDDEVCHWLPFALFPVLLFLIEALLASF